MRKNCPIQDGDQKEREGTKEPCQEHFQVELRNKGMKLQERRHLKQVTQFVHKDSADLLPLDGMKRLGTSKDLQPHNIVQRRLLEGNFTNRIEDNDHIITSEESTLVKEKKEEEKQSPKAPASLLVHCKCQSQPLRAIVNTGCQHNLISRSCLKHLGLQEVPTNVRNAPPCISRIVGEVERVEVQFGQEMVQCSALVVDDETLEFCFGLQTLLSLKVTHFLIGTEHKCLQCQTAELH